MRTDDTDAIGAAAECEEDADAADGFATAIKSNSEIFGRSAAAEDDGDAV